MKRISIFTFICLSLFIVSAKLGPSSSGAPPSHTGAPNENSCAVSGCHDDNKVNSGSAKVGIFINDSLHTTYEPGKTYQIKVRIADADINRFGYQLVALNDNNENAGSFQITDRKLTQLEHNTFELLDRQYVTYTFNGTGAIAPGIMEWSVNWTAPKNTGDVTFYTGAVAANDDETDKGDHVYLTNLTIHAKK